MKGIITTISPVSSVDFEMTIHSNDNWTSRPWQYLKISLNENVYYFSVLQQDKNNIKLLVRAKQPISEKLNLFLNSLNKEVEFEILWNSYFNSEENYSNNLLISMGSWISPILNILSTCKENKWMDNIILHSEKNYNNVPYLDNLPEETVLFLTDEKSKLRRKDFLNRVTTYLSDIKNIEEDYSKIRKIKRIFLCWNKEFVSSIKDLLINNLWFNEQDILS